MNSGPPFDFQAEQAVVGAVLCDGASLARVYGGLRPSHFYTRSLADVYGAMCARHARGFGVDVIMLRDYLTERGVWDEELEAALVQAAAAVPSAAGIEDYARIVLKLAQRREWMAAGAHLQEAAANGDGLEEARARTVEVLSSTPQTSRVPRFRSIEELADDQESVSWLVEGVVAPGYVTLFAGKPKGGKSTLLFALLAALARGRAFVGLRTLTASAVYLSEEAPKTIRQKVRRFGLEGAVFLTRLDGYPRRLFGQIIDEAVAEAHRTGAMVIVVDTMTFWAGLPPDAEKDSGAMQAAADHLLRAAATGLAVIVLHHTRKALGEDIDTVRGSNALTGAVDIIATVKSGEGPGERLLRVFGRDEECPERLIVKLVGDGYERVGGEPAVQDLGAAVLAVLPPARHEGLTQEDICGLLQARKESVLAALEALRDRGRADRRGKGTRGSPYRYSRIDPPIDSVSVPDLQVEGREQNPEGSSRTNSSGDSPDSGTLKVEGDAVPEDVDVGRGTETESGRGPKNPMGKGDSGHRDAVSGSTAFGGAGTETETSLASLPPVPWLGYSSGLWVIWDDLWSRWQERAAVLEADGGLARRDAELQAWAEVAAP